jgi:tripartite-type tricarboxylate transporter receptor subunit TctC
MPVSRRTVLMSAAALGAAVAAARPASTQEAYPSRPVRVVVPWAPGGAVDTIARRVAQKLAEQTGQPFVVENKAGATGTIGAAEVARARPDGHTLLAMDNTYAMLPHLFHRLPFDHARAFQPVTVSAFSPVLLAVGRASPFATLGALVEAAKKDPEKVTYGTGGVGSAPHFATAAFQQAAGIKLYHVPFKGAGEAVTAALGGQVDMVMVSPGSALGNIQGGLLRPLAISGGHRSAALPDTPTFAEAGLPGFGVVNWSGLAVPRGTPAPVVERLHAEVGRALAAADVKEFLDSLASEPGGMPPADFTRLLAEETERWRKVAAEGHIERQ